MNRKHIDYNELAKQKKLEDYAKARNKVPAKFRPPHPTQKTRARAKVHYSTKRGKLIPQPCAVCGALKSEAHHPDYSMPLDVIWLCKDHHAQEHYPNRVKKEHIIVQPKYTEAQIVGNVYNVLKSKALLNAFIKRRTPKSQW